MTPLAVGRLASDSVVDGLEGAVGRRGEAALEGAVRVVAAAGEAADAVEQGLTLVHFPAQREHFLWDT